MMESLILVRGNERNSDIHLAFGAFMRQKYTRIIHLGLDAPKAARISG